MLAWLLTPVVSGHGVTVVKETGSFLRAKWAAGSQQADGLWLDLCNCLLPTGRETRSILRRKKGFGVWVQAGLSGGSGLRILPRRFPIPPSLPRLPPFLPFLPCAELRVTSCSETEGFSSSIFNEAAEEPRRGAAAAFPRRRRQLLRGGTGSGGHRSPPGPCPQHGAACQSLPAGFVPAGRVFCPSGVPSLSCHPR